MLTKDRIDASLFGEDEIVQRFRKAVAERLPRRAVGDVLRSMFDDVDAALGRGLPYADLAAALLDAGAVEKPVAIQTLRNNVVRIRKERAHAAEKEIAQAKVARLVALPAQATAPQAEPAPQAAAAPASAIPLQEPVGIGRDHDAPVVEPEPSAEAPSAEVSSAEPVVGTAKAEVSSTEPASPADGEKSLPPGVTRKRGRTFMNVKAMLGEHTRAERFEFVDVKPDSSPSF